MTASLYSNVFGADCDSSSSLEDQQQECFTEMADPTESEPIVFHLFKAALIADGVGDVYAGTVATQMTNALEPRNFTCKYVGDQQSHCHFHPIVQRINVLPDRLELVFSPEVPDWQQSPEQDLLQLYHNLPALQRYADPTSDPEQYCYLTYWRQDGVSTYVVHGKQESD